MTESGRSVLLTGGTGGLGVAVTKRLLADGWRVVVPWITEKELERLDSHPRLVLARADLFDPAGVAEVAALAGGDEQAPLRAVVNLVGGFASGARVHESPIEDFEAMLRLNLRPLYLCTQAALPFMIDAGGGSVVAMSTKAAFAPFSGASGYVTSKAAVLAFISALAVEYRDEGIRANAVLPSVIDTPGNRASQPGSSRKGWVAPEAIAEVIAFLIGESSAAMTGAQVPVPGVG
ncbi:NAD(P)-dependent dehydrogenase (short-subunit alcohol dehydrogenase family) [Rhodococcus sp. PvR044]|jgi:NAD(P)-dependent dehydrogenase (short-subunit alcohol dehydrogenase family)|uniref:SDR family NAD(P)-dependent oxidoreductase n=1 Tax=Rhodococcus sp. PvR044 TaxID=3156402 RepID=UPI003396F0DA